MAASAAITSMLGSWAWGAPAVQSTATVLVNTEAIPKATPAAPARITLRTTGRCTRRAATKSTATAPAVVTARASRSAPAGVWASALPVSDSSPASPAVAMTAPRHAVGPALRRTNRAAMGRANTMVRAPSGWTRLSGPYARAATCSSAPTPLSATAVHQRPLRNGA